MDGVGKKVWGYDKTNDVWLPIQVDANGKLIVDMSAISLDDIGDIDLTGIADGDILYWDDATSLWKVKAESIFTCADLASCDLNDLGDVNIPAPATLDFIYWDDTAGKWVNISYATLLASIQGDTSLNELADVDTSGVADGNVLYYDSATATWKVKAPYTSPTTTAGDMIKRGDAADERLPIGDNDQVLTVVAGAPAWAAAAAGAIDISAHVYNDTRIPITVDSLWKTVGFNSEHYDTDNMHDCVTNNHRLTANTAGKYLCGAAVLWDANATGVRGIQIKKSGGGTVMTSYLNACTGGIMHCSYVVAITQLAVDEYLWVEVWQNSGGPGLYLNVNNWSPSFWAVRLA